MENTTANQWGTEKGNKREKELTVVSGAGWIHHEEGGRGNVGVIKQGDGSLFFQ